jgi:RimJ/RimL family protein N-acetyltransferase
MRCPGTANPATGGSGHPVLARRLPVREPGAATSQRALAGVSGPALSLCQAAPPALSLSPAPLGDGGEQAGHNAPVEHFRTVRLVVRDWTVADLEASFGIWSRVEVTRWAFGGRPPVSSLTEMRRMLDRRVELNQENPDFGMWAVELRATGEVAGAVILRRLRADSQDLEIGWHFNPDYWGAGYATEAGRGLVGLAFGLDRFGPERVWPDVAARRGRPATDRVQALVDPDNPRSQSVCRRIGMRHLGQAAHDGLTVEIFELERQRVQAEEAAAGAARAQDAGVSGS